MGVVYRATDLRLNRDVALKVLPADLVHDSDRRRRFVQEAQAASALEHPHIAVIHEVDPGLWFALGSAHLAQGNAAEAERWFQKIADSTFDHTFAPIDYVRACYHLGQLREKRGDTEKARDAYRRFVSYWKDGDLDRERIREAQQKLTVS